MINTLGEEEFLRKKVWNTLNLIQANQLFVHSKNLEVKYYDEKKNKTIIFNGRWSVSFNLYLK